MPSWFWPTITGLNYLLGTGVILALLRRRKQPAATLAWILAIYLMPFIGSIIYVLIGDTRIERQVRRRRQRRGVIAPGLARQSEPGESAFATPGADAFDPRIRDLVTLATRVGEQPPAGGNDVTLLRDAERTFLALSLAIEAAESHVHLEYYIFKADDTGRAVAELLQAKARQGVACRLLLDAVGCWGMPGDMIRRLEDAGVEVAFFLPVGLSAKKLFRINCRNHRKLVVIDGRVVFTGSQNIGDEYLGRKRRLGPWRDTHMRIIGPAASQAQEVFVEDWHFATGRDLSDDETLFPNNARAGDSIVQLVASGPDRLRGALHMLLLAAVSAARRTVLIITPYFVPDMAMILALATAAMRGVRVRLMVPARSDSRVVVWAGRSYYADLIQSGVEIYEYQDGMLHSKVVVIDAHWSLVGSANMDIRSFNINFELTGLLYDEGLSRKLAADFANLVTRARRITTDTIADRRFGESIVLGMARLASPLL